MRITIEHYLATNNPREVEELLKRKGVPPPKNLPDAIGKLNLLMKREGNEIVKELSLIKTPYSDLNLSTQEEKVSSACGCSSFGGNGGEQISNCSGCDKCPKSNADAEQPSGQAQPQAQAQPSTQETEDKVAKYAPIVAIGLLLVVTTAVLVKK